MQTLPNTWTDTDRKHCLLHAALCLIFVIIHVVSACQLEAVCRIVAIIAAAALTIWAFYDFEIIRQGRYDYAPVNIRHIFEGLILPTQAMAFVLMMFTCGSVPAQYLFGALSAICFTVYFVLNVW